MEGHREICIGGTFGTLLVCNTISKGHQKWTIQRNWQTRAYKTKQTKQKHNTICVGHHYAQTNTSNVNKLWTTLTNTRWCVFVIIGTNTSNTPLKLYKESHM